MHPRLRSLALCLAVSATAHAATLNVGPGQTYTTIQSAINAASTGDFIQVAPGTYTENIDYKSKGLSISCNSSCSTSTPGIIDGNGLGPVVTITNITTNSSATLYGFTIQNGGKPQTTGGPQGGIYIANASPNIQNNILTKNFCAGIVSTGGTPTIFTNQIRNTLTTGCAAAEGLGSGIALSGSTGIAYIYSNLIELNTASVAFKTDTGGGGAINITTSATVYIYQNTLRNNTTTGYGGALYVATTPNLYFIENLVYGNKGISGGLDIVIPGKSVGPLAGELSSNTILDNTATTTTGSSDVFLGGNLSQYAIANNIVVGYVAKEIVFDCAAIYATQTTTPLVFDHNDIYALSGTNATPVGGACPSPTGTFGNISADPQFVNGTAAAVTAGTQDFHIASSTAPVVDTGNNSSPGATPTQIALLDLDGNTRIQDASGKGYPIIDMGVYELSGQVNVKPTYLVFTPSTYSPTTGGPLTLITQLGYTASLGSPAGTTVTYYEDGTSIGTATLSSTGSANFSVTNLTAGTHSFYATFAQQGAFTPSVSAAQYLLVTTPAGNNTTETLVSSVNPSNVGQSVTFTAHLSSANATVPTGTITFTDNGTTIATIQTVDTSGNAAVTTSTLTPGSHTITAAYTPTGTFSASSASLTQVVAGYQSQSVLTVNPTSAAAGSPVNLTATVSSLPPSSTVPTGSVIFYNGSTAISPSIMLSSGVATLTTSTLPGGTDNLTCAYSGDTTFSPSNCNIVPVTIAAVATTLTLTSSANPSAANVPITFTATLTSTSNSQPIANTSLNFYLTLASGSQLVVPVTTNSSGVATYTNPGLAPGSYPVAVVLPASATYSPSTAALIQVVSPIASSLTLTSSANPSPVLSPITFTATLTASGQPVPNATVTLSITIPRRFATTVTLTTNASGIATYTSPGLALGSYTVTVTFAATPTYLASSASLTEVVSAVSTTTSLTASPNPSPQGQTVTLTALINATTGVTAPTGNVQFFDGGNLIGTAPFALGTPTSSTAYLSVSTFSIGVHSLTATYVPDTTNFLSSQSATFSETIQLQDFTLTTGSPTLTIATGHKSTLPLTLTSIGAFAGPVFLSCTGTLPPYVTCEPPTLSLTSGTTSTATLTVDTNRILNFYGANHSAPPTHSTPAGTVAARITLASLLPLTLLLGLSRRRRISLRRALGTTLTLGLLCLVSTALTGCTGFYPASTPPGSYPITLTATGTPIGGTTPLTHTTTFTLIVTP